MTNTRVPATARRAEVARLRVRRLTTRQIADLVGTSQSTVVNDLKALASVWAKHQGDYNDQLTATLMDIDAMQAAAVQVLDEAIGLDKLPAIDRAIKAIELRSKLRGLFPKLGTGEPDIPTGPLMVTIELIDRGNRQLVSNSLELDGTEDDEITEAMEAGDFARAAALRGAMETERATGRKAEENDNAHDND